jgi:hypothetical protein
MNYIELINDFWAYCEENHVSANEKVTYFAILNYCNKLNWKNPFMADWSVLVQYSGISKNTHYSCIEMLHERKLIDYKKGVKNKLKAEIFILKIKNKTKNNIENNFENKTKTKIENLDKHLNLETNKLKNNYLANADRDLSFIAKFIRENKPDFLEPYIDCWNMFAEKFGKQKIIKLTNSREQKLKARLKDETFIFPDILNKAHKQLFITENNWFTFDWVLQNETNYLKVLEGNYMTKPKQEPTPPHANKLNRYNQ